MLAKRAGRPAAVTLGAGSLVLGWLVLQPGTDDRATLLVALGIGALSLAIMTGVAPVLSPRGATIASVAYLLYAVVIVVPALLLFFDQEGSYRYRYLFAVLSALITVPAGAFLASAALRFRREEIGAYHSAAVGTTRVAGLQVLVYALVLALVLALSLRYISEVRTIPLLYMLESPGDASDLAEVRDESLKLLDSPLRFAYHVARDFGYPMLILVALGCALVTRQLKWKAAFAVSALAGVTFASLTTARLPAAAIVAQLVAFLYLYRGGRMGWSVAMLGSSAFVLYPLAVVVLTQEVSVGEGLETIGLRLFFAPAHTLYYYFLLVPEEVDYLYGRGMGSLTRLVGVQYFDMGHVVSQAIAPGGAGYGSANAAFVSGLYADFGLPGVLVGGVITGAVMQWVSVLILRQEKTPLNLASHAMAMYIFALLTTLPLPSVLVFSGLPVLVAIAYWPRVGSRIRRGGAWGWSATRARA